MSQTARGTVTLDASGEGSVALQPRGAWSSWLINRITVEVVPADSSECRIYRGDVDGGDLVLTTYSGALDTASGSPVDLVQGERLTARWTGGSPGGKASIVATYEVM